MKVLHLKAGLAKKTTPNIIIVEIYTYLFILFPLARYKIFLPPSRQTWEVLYQMKKILVCG